MAFENLFIRTAKSIGGIQLDAVITESHDNTVRVTNNPIELGTDITDNAVVEPKTIVIEARVSDTPLGLAALTEIVDNVSGLFGSSTGNQTRSVSAYNSLVSLQDSRSIISIQTKLRLYDNMIITNIKTLQDKNTSRVADMVISAKEVNIVSTEVAQIEADSLQEGQIREQGSPSSNRGRQSPISPDENVNKSVLKNALDWIVE